MGKSALVGGAWLMRALGYNMSVAVAVGFIALAGAAAETGVVMLIYLDHAMVEVRRRGEGLALSRADLRQAIMTGAVERVRPKMMTVVAIIAGLPPILRSTGTGPEVMCRVAVPMVGGMVSSTLLTLLVIPAIYAIVKGWLLPRENLAVPAVDREPVTSPAECPTRPHDRHRAGRSAGGAGQGGSSSGILDSWRERARR